VRSFFRVSSRGLYSSHHKVGRPFGHRVETSINDCTSPGVWVRSLSTDNFRYEAADLTSTGCSVRSEPAAPVCTEAVGENLLEFGPGRHVLRWHTLVAKITQGLVDRLVEISAQPVAEDIGGINPYLVVA